MLGEKGGPWVANGMRWHRLLMKNIAGLIRVWIHFRGEREIEKLEDLRVVLRRFGGCWVWKKKDI